MDAMEMKGNEAVSHTLNERVYTKPPNTRRYGELHSGEQTTAKKNYNSFLKMQFHVKFSYGFVCPAAYRKNTHGYHTRIYTYNIVKTRIIWIY